MRNFFFFVIVLFLVSIGLDLVHSQSIPVIPSIYSTQMTQVFPEVCPKNQIKSKKKF